MSFSRSTFQKRKKKYASKKGEDVWEMYTPDLKFFYYCLTSFEK